MSNLVLEIRAGDQLIINGALLTFRVRSRIELMTRARFLFGKQIMACSDANTPARRIYYALQETYVGPEEGRAQALEQVRSLIHQFANATTSKLAREILDRLLTLAEADEHYQALKLVRRLVRHEDAVLGELSSAAD